MHIGNSGTCRSDLLWGLLLLGLINLSGAAWAGSASSALLETVRTESGIVEGVRSKAGILSFKGIPYALPPVGNLRWRAPAPAASWSKPLKAREYKPKCWGVIGVLPTPGAASEDCLYLNVWSGARQSDDRLPVMVWIHGGGFLAGTASTDRTDGSVLAEHGVVVVTLNYRVAVLGFLVHPDLDREAGGHSGNYGLLDQIAALRWIQKNISAFGGDPSNVTIFGQSAGSESVSLLMSSPLAADLFHRAIGQSGAFWESESGPIRHADVAKSMGGELQHKLGAEGVVAMRQVSAAELQAATPWKMSTDPGTTSYGPVMDGYVIPKQPYDIFANHEQNDVPLMAGWTGREDGPFQGRALPNGTKKAFLEAAEKKFGYMRMEAFRALYPADTDAQAKESALLLVGDEAMSFPTWSWLQVQTRTGSSPVWGYVFDISSSYTAASNHGSDVPYVFGVFPGPNEADAKDRELSRLMQAYWTNFAKEGNPNGSDLPNWQRYVESTQLLMELTADPGSKANSSVGRFKFLREFRRGF